MRSSLPDWGKYWHNYSDLFVLRQKLNNIDDTLVSIEIEFDTKLLSGDQMDLIDELENRIEALKKVAVSQNAVIQGDLFAMD